MKSLICFLVCAVLSLGTIHAKTLILSATEGERPTQKAAEIVISEIYEQLGITVVIRYYPGERALTLSNKGKTDGEVVRIAGISKIYPNLIQIPVATGSSEASVFSKNFDFPVRGWESLQPYRVGILRGSKFAEMNTEGMDRTIGINANSLFRMLYLDRVDVVVAVRLNGLVTLKRMNLHNTIRDLKPPIIKGDYFHYLHKKHEALVSEVTELMERMKEDGSLQELIERADQQVLEALD